MKRITMTYPPSNGTNDLFDGRRHDIIPRQLSLVIIGGRRFYLLEYYDENMGINCVSILIEINGHFAKVPLDNYNLLGELLEGLPMRTMNIDILPEHITLCQTLAIEPLIETKFQREPMFEFNRYLAYDIANPINSHRRKYSSSGLIIRSDSPIQEYCFSKEAEALLIDKQLQAELSSHLSELKQGKTLDVTFEIDVAPGTTATLPEVIGNRTVLRKMLLIPGKHKYNFFAAPCKDKERDNLSIRCNNCNIYAPVDEYRDLHDQRKAFQNGFNGVLDISFDSRLSKDSYNKTR